MQLAVFIAETTGVQEVGLRLAGVEGYLRFHAAPPGMMVATLASMTSRQDFGQNLRVCRWGVTLALFSILFGFAMGGVFGAFEDPLRAGLTERAEAVRDSVYGGDAAKMKGVVDKSWSYYKRAHLHGGGIGAAALGAILLLASLRRPKVMFRRGLALGIGLGSLGYPVFWMLAARRAPGLGSTAVAKESLSWLAVPSAGLLLLGLLGVLVLTAMELFAPKSER